MRCVKKGDWKLIQYDAYDGQSRHVQLFNLADNPEEFLAEHHAPQVVALTGVTPTKQQANLAGDPAHAAKLKEMQDLLLAEMRRLEDPWRLWNQPTTVCLRHLLRSGPKARARKRSRKRPWIPTRQGDLMKTLLFTSVFSFLRDRRRQASSAANGSCCKTIRTARWNSTI